MNFAVIGLGSFGIKRAQAIKNSKLAKSVCIYDISDDNAEKAKKILKVPINKYDDIFNEKRFDKEWLFLNRFHLTDLANKYIAESLVKKVF